MRGVKLLNCRRQYGIHLNGKIRRAIWLPYLFSLSSYRSFCMHSCACWSYKSKHFWWPFQWRRISNTACMRSIKKQKQIALILWNHLPKSFNSIQMRSGEVKFQHNLSIRSLANANSTLYFQVGQIFFKTFKISVFNHIYVEHHIHKRFDAFNRNGIS